VKNLLFLLILITSPAAFAEEISEEIIFKKFIPTAFGIRSRTIDRKDAEAVIKEVKNFKLSEPSAKISRLEILTCTSDYPLPQTSITNRKVNEHAQLALERNEMIKSTLSKALPHTIVATSKVCGPKFNPEDLNNRFVIKESGPLFATKLNELHNNSEFVKSLKEEALIEDSALLVDLYPSPFLAKYKPFQGIRLLIWGLVTESKTPVKPKALPSGKSQ
jgi:hypothetical protein